jgi:PucR C-terminal helix-turn-helix domain
VDHRLCAHVTKSAGSGITSGSARIPPIVGDRLEPSLVPSQLGAALAAGLPYALDEIAVLFRDKWPQFAQFLDEERSEVLIAIEGPMHELVTRAEAGQAPDQLAEPLPELVTLLFTEVGAAQYREGRHLSDLLGAYRVAARVGWRHLGRIATAAGASAETLAALADEMFLLVDALASATADGYVAEHAEQASSRERQREELAELLLADRSSMAAVRELAARCRWRLPSSAALVLVDAEDPTAPGTLRRLGPESLPVRWASMLGGIVPDSAGPGQRDRLASALAGVPAVVGPTVPLDRLPGAARITETAARLRREGVLPADPLFVDEHLDTIIVHRDRDLLAALRRRALAPLDGCGAGVRRRLEQTLAAWLRYGGDRAAVAAALQIHPQTVRYRLKQLRELFGPELDRDPDTRLRLTLALGWGPPRDPTA